MPDSLINQNEQAREAERAVLGGLMLERELFFWKITQENLTSPL